MTPMYYTSHMQLFKIWWH